jgi:hypothetical protein
MSSIVKSGNLMLPAAHQAESQGGATDCAIIYGFKYNFDLKTVLKAIMYLNMQQQIVKIFFIEKTV